MAEQDKNSDFKDLFSSDSEKYAAFRPQYPAELFEWLAKQCEQKELAWDCATGNGQAAIHLASIFKKVIATDPSPQQLQYAPLHQNIEYRCERAEEPSLNEKSVDLITIAQALHWLDINPFYDAVNKVLKPNGIIAAIAYGLPEISTEIDHHVRHLHNEILGKYWEYERQHVINLYKDIPFHFAPIPTPQFYIETLMNQTVLLGYLATWSGLKKYQMITGTSPLEAFAEKIHKAWPTQESHIPVVWKLVCKVGRNN